MDKLVQKGTLVGGDDVQSIATEFRYILRRLIHSPTFTAISLITLAVGIGANTAIFSVVNGVLLKPLPYPDSNRLVSVWHTAPGLGMAEINSSPATYFTYREESKTLEDSGIWQGDSVSVTGVGEPEQIPSLSVSDGVLPVLRVNPLIGREFNHTDDSPGSSDTVMLTYGYWQKRFGGDRSVLGRRLIIDGKAREVIGVLPQTFRFLDMTPQLLLPLKLERNKVFVGNFSFQGVARLKDGVSLAQANADVGRMLPLMIRKFPPPPGFSTKLFEDARLGPNLRLLKRDVIGDVGPVLWILMGTVGMVLLIACANVANLLLVRAEGRQQELAIRAALGASRAQIARELLLESVTLGILGGALGIGLAYGALRLLVVLGPANLPRLDQISIDTPVLLFTLVLSLFAGVLFGIVPVFKYAGPRLGTTLREGGRTISQGRDRHRARNTLVIVQVALALVLLISSGLMIRTFLALKHVQPGVQNPEQLLTLRVSIPDSQVPNPDQVVRMQNNMVEKIAALQGVTSVGLANGITMDGTSNNDLLLSEDRPNVEGKLPPVRRFKFCSPNLFHTMGNPLLAGRDFTWTDIYQKRPVVLISENLAKEYWGGASAAIGKRVRENPKGEWRDIIGVVGDEHDDGVNVKAPTIVYLPLVVKDFWGDPVSVRRTIAFAIRSPRTGTASFLQEVRQAIWSVNSSVPVADVRTAAEIVSRSMARTSFTLVMLALAGGMALLLGVVGIYGVISYSVSQRTREIGIRMALGAPQGTVQRMFVRNGLVLAAVGVCCGIVAAVALTRLMTKLLYDISPLDPVTYGCVAVVLVAAALLASYIPARKATSIDPSEALRLE